MHAFVSKRSEAEEIMKVRSRLFRRPQEEEEGEAPPASERRAGAPKAGDQFGSACPVPEERRR